MVKRLPPPPELGRRPGDTEEAGVEVGWTESDGVAVALLTVLDDTVELMAPKSSIRLDVLAVTYPESFAMEG